MNSLVEDLSSTKKRIIIEVQAAEVEQEIQKSLNEVKKKTKMAGFRPGKAPMSLIEKRYRKGVETEVLERLIPDYYADAVKSANLSPLTQPVVERRDYESRGDLKLVCSVEVRPTVEGLQYEGLPVKEITVDVQEDEVQGQLKRIAISKSTYAPVDRPLRVDDLIVADLDVIEENKILADQFIKVGSDMFPNDFYTPLLGLSRGESNTISLSFPDDFHNADFRGKTLTFKVMIKDVKDLSTPVLDDEFAKDVGFDNLDALVQNVREGLLDMKKDRALKTQKGELVKSLVEKYDFEVPEGVLQTELDSVVRQMKTYDTYKELPEELLREKFRDDAIQSVKSMVILDIIGEKENVKITEEELKNKLIQQAYAASVSPESLLQYYKTQEGALDMLKYTLFREKVVDIIYSRCDKGDLQASIAPATPAEGSATPAVEAGVQDKKEEEAQ